MNNFHSDINFTFESEDQNQISFLDVLISRKPDGSFSTKVYRKKTDNNIYINWKAFAPKSWKIGTLKGIFRRAYLICSEKEDLEKEIQYIKQVFNKTNGYPSGDK